ncbi:MAG TPA: hypothetical protein VFO60_06295, partial [Candidatus Dormibacteraeota bacterium]|nr:hypothetical protein [Candidatus Dormibacteraeota bacterium]
MPNDPTAGRPADPSILVDVDALLAAAMPGPGRPAPEREPVAVVAEQLFTAPETGLTAHRKVVTRAD